MASQGGPDIIEDNFIFYVDAANTKSYPGTGTAWNDLSGNANNGTVDGTVFKSSSVVAQSFTCRLRADYNVSWTQYSCMSGSDRDGNFALYEADPTINLYLGDTITFDLSTDSGLNAAAGPLYITTTRPSVTSVTNPTATNNGSSNQDISWTPNAAGTYYYQNSSRIHMWGVINVTDTTSSTPCMSFDGTNDNIKIPMTGDINDTLFNGSNNVTVEFWFNANNLPASGGSNAQYSQVLLGGGGRRFFIVFGDSLDDKEVGVRCYIVGGSWISPVGSGANSIDDNTWYNVIVTYNSSSGFVLYLNGDQKSTSSTTGTITSSTYDADNRLLGCLVDDTSSASYQNRFFDGEISICRIYNRVLTAAEVKQNFDALKRRYEL